MKNKIKIGNLYHVNIHYGTQDFPLIMLCLNLKINNTDILGEFLNLHNDKIEPIYLWSFYDKRFIEIKE